MSNIIINPFALAGNVFNPLGGAMARAIQSGASYVARSTSSALDMDLDDAFTVNMWVKDGWTSNNPFVEFFNITAPGSTDNNNDHFRFYFHRQHNRMYAIVTDTVSGTEYGRHNFWYMHQSANNVAANFGTGTSSSNSNYWRTATGKTPHINGDGYGMLTFMKQSSTGAEWVHGKNLQIFWNGRLMGTYGSYTSTPFYANGANTGSNGATSSSHISWSGEKDFILGSSNAGTNYGDGNPTKYSEVSVWGKALSEAEVAALTTDSTAGDVANRTATNPMIHSAAADLLHYWPLHTDGTDFKGNGDLNIGSNSITTI